MSEHTAPPQQADHNADILGASVTSGIVGLAIGGPVAGVVTAVVVGGGAKLLERSLRGDSSPSSKQTGSLTR
jgi:hypothetical protein